MWNQYKNNLVGMQLTIAIVTTLVFLRSNYWLHPLAFFVAMQLGSVAGAAWANRLKRKLGANPCCLSTTSQ